MGKPGINRKAAVSAGLITFVVALNVAFTVFTITNMARFSADVTKYKDISDDIKAAKDLQMNVLHMRDMFTEAALTKIKSHLTEESREVADRLRTSIDYLERINAKDKTYVENMQSMKDNIGSMIDVGNRMVDAFTTTGFQAINAMNEFEQIGQQFIEEASTIVQEEEMKGRVLIENIQNGAVNTEKTTIFVALAVVAAELMAILVILLLRRALRPLSGLTEKIESIAGGDLTVRVDSSSGDEVGILARSVNKMVDSLSRLIGEILSSASSVGVTVKTLKTRAEETEQGAKRQSGQATQIAASAEEMTKTIGSIAQNAAAASEISTQAMNVAANGREIANSAVDTVAKVRSSTAQLGEMILKLNHRSKEIGEIVSVISSIADQTNLLALNAAIEAARAGEQGQGFAVVADEVRKLAERTIAATAEIAEKIKAIQTESSETTKSMELTSEEVTKATEYIAKMSNSLTAIVEAAQRSRDQIMQIATAAEEQSATSEEVSRNIEQTAVIAADMEKMANAVRADVQDLHNVSTVLVESTSGFRTNGNGRHIDSVKLPG